jgi:uncharacterized membrane protein
LIDRIARLATPDRVWVYPVAIAVIQLCVFLGALALYERDPILDPFGKFLGNDFVAFYTGGRFWNDNRIQDLYDLPEQYAFQQSLIQHETTDYFNPYVNPPHAVLIYAPFSQWSYLPSLGLWLTFGISAACGAAWLLKSAIPGHWRAWDLSLLILLFPATLTWLFFGQATGLILFIHALTLALLCRDRDFLAGFVLAQLAFKPQLALPLAIPLIVTLRWRALLGGLMGLSFWIGLTAWMFPRQGLEYLNFGDDIVQLLRSAGYPREGIHSIFGTVSLLLDPISPRLSDWMTMLISAAIVAALVYLWWKAAWQTDSRLWWTRLAITLPLASLLSIQLFTYDLVLWLIPFAIVVGLVRESGKSFLNEGPILGWSVLLFVWTFLAMPWNHFVLHQMTSLDLPSMTIQPTPILIIGWCWAVWRRLGRDDRAIDATAVPASNSTPGTATAAEIA